MQSIVLKKVFSLFSLVSVIIYFNIILNFLLTNFSLSCRGKTTNYYKFEFEQDQLKLQTKQS